MFFKKGLFLKCIYFVILSYMINVRISSQVIVIYGTVAE